MHRLCNILCAQWNYSASNPVHPAKMLSSLPVSEMLVLDIKQLSSPRVANHVGIEYFPSSIIHSLLLQQSMHQQISVAYVAKGRAMLKKTCIASVCLLTSKMDGGSEVEKNYSLQCLYFFSVITSS